ncbi:hypothetical protein EON63_16050 [archaeon]|nr:MAG: hypothetical protein EON63_16050 [archaeon]
MRYHITHTHIHSCTSTLKYTYTNTHTHIHTRICTSVDYGNTFTISFSTQLSWSDISVSGDASTVYATVYGGDIYKYKLT